MAIKKIKTPTKKTRKPSTKKTKIPKMGPSMMGTPGKGYGNTACPYVV